MSKDPNLKILLVDDDEVFARLMASQLTEEFGHMVTVAKTGQEARTLIERSVSGFDLILTDYDMPVMNGLELLKWMQETGVETPSVLVTAAGSEAVEVEALKLGAYDYVRKERLDLSHLAVVIKGTYERRQFQIARVLEEDRAKEIGLNNLATDKARDVLNAITPTLNAALARITSDLETQGAEIEARLSHEEKAKFRELLASLQHEVAAIEAGIRGLLGLYRMLYAHHAEVNEIERVRKEFVERTPAHRRAGESSEEVQGTSRL